ncbi:MAG: hypothetical protein CME64_03030 [Halobacteriovoraceae bacterium]|nr:hypothetical protein [Halobacteriovoraceae bacterium]|tara:strand:- start:2275 stop:2718 length:444 start_codon:yes stop_codon:yes gene_type:complete
MKTFFYVLTLTVSFNAISSDIIGKYSGTSDSGHACEVEITSQDKDKFVAQLYIKNKKIVKVTSGLYDGELVKSGRHNIECADSGDFCFWPFETADKVIELDYEGGHELSRINYITRKLTSWSYGELSSQEGLVSRLRASCNGLEKKI